MGNRLKKTVVGWTTASGVNVSDEVIGISPLLYGISAAETVKIDTEQYMSWSKAIGDTIFLECNVTGSLMMISAVLLAMASGVLFAYGLCVAMFGMFRIHARQVAGSSARPVTSSARVV